MSGNLVGKEIRRLRLHLGLTQEEVSKDICNQSMLSKIEKGETYPSANILYQLSQRLNVDMEHFFLFANIQDVSYMKKIQSSLREAVRRKDYAEVKNIVLKEENDFKSDDSLEWRQFLLWHKGMAYYYADGNPDKAIETIKRALEIREKIKKVELFSEQELSILNTMGVIYAELKEHKKAYEIYLTCIEELEKRELLKDLTIYIRVLYNFSKVLTHLGEYDHSITVCKNGLDQCIKGEFLYLYGEFVYHIGYNYELQNEVHQAIKQYKQAVHIFNLQNNLKNTEFISKKIKELSNLAESK
ncbi:helix-turn-helix domain-containing protein [Sutcliffiella sp. NC1]|uniref:helix-turn-helix domain-containing protein n=1 Tax=Sutcliffiella sp. NC1 TaxID=3004096 RepID=UPI0022DE24C6|nr:helix-turn-helix domain-containing protein [Sutcliffiella sp. NC1]WBL14742.1 helix-turn-helix domain-containing protein [Sutcliffiella sp. NC1]